jgi:hypothetical protein
MKQVDHLNLKSSGESKISNFQPQEVKNCQPFKEDQQFSYLPYQDVHPFQSQEAEKWKLYREKQASMLCLF